MRCRMLDRHETPALDVPRAPHAAVRRVNAPHGRRGGTPLGNAEDGRRSGLQDTAAGRARARLRRLRPMPHAPDPGRRPRKSIKPGATRPAAWR